MKLHDTGEPPKCDTVQCAGKFRDMSSISSNILSCDLASVRAWARSELDKSIVPTKTNNLQIKMSVQPCKNHVTVSL